MTAKRRNKRSEQKKQQLILLLILLAVFIIFMIVAKHYSDGHQEEQSGLIDLPLITEAPPTPTPVPRTDIPTPDEYNGTDPWVIINNGEPFFTDEEKHSTDPFENYSPLDSLGRCGEAYANICIELMPTEPRGEIGAVKPTGWHSVKYDIVDGRYLYNRCHLIGFQLAGENANERNLITGTRYMNIQGMLDAENMVADYVKETRNHVLYRVTPIFRGGNLVADGVLIEAWSVEDAGEGICICIFAFNVQPGITIDYATGDSHLD